MKRTRVFTGNCCLAMSALIALLTTACSGGTTGCPEGEGASLQITTAPSPAKAPADGKSKIHVTVSGQDDMCQPLRDTQVELRITDRDPSDKEVGKFAANNGDTITLNMGTFGASTDVISSVIGTARLTAFCAEHNLTAMPVSLEFETPPVTGQCAVEINVNPAAIEADGTSTAMVTATLTADDGSNSIADGTEVHFSTDKGKFTESNASEYTALSTGSQATATIQSVQLPADQEQEATINVTFLCDDGENHSNQETVRFTHLDQPRVDLRSSKDAVLADGVDEAVLTATVYEAGGLPVPAGLEVDFVINDGPGSFKENGQTLYTATTDDNGEATATFVGGTEQGQATITANALVAQQAAYDEVTVNVKALGGVIFDSAVPERLGLKGSGRDESSVVTFYVVDTSDQPLPDIQVNFEHSNAPGVTLDPVSARTDASGRVQTVLSSGPSPTTVTVTATARMGSGNPISAPSSPISIVGAKPSAAKFTFSCEAGKLNMGSFGLNNFSIHCIVQLADRFSNKIGIATNVQFRSEAGAIQGLAVTDENEANMGVAQTTFTTADPRPWDVAPGSGEPSISYQVSKPCSEDGDCRVDAQGQFDPTHMLDTCPSANTCRHTNNPRDGLVTIIAYTTGEEAFNDANGNGQYDAGVDTFSDMSEPYVDANDNGVYDGPNPALGFPGEEFTDINGNGAFDAGNGVWDSDTTIWKQAKVSWTGGVAVDANLGEHDCSSPKGNRFSVFCAGDPNGPFSPTFTVGYQQQITLWWEVKDFNLNPLNETLSVNAKVNGKGKINSSSPPLSYNAPDAVQGDWSNCGGGFCGSIVIEGTNSTAIAEDGSVQLDLSWRDAPGAGNSHNYSLLINGTFSP